MRSTISGTNRGRPILRHDTWAPVFRTIAVLGLAWILASAAMAQTQGPAKSPSPPTPVTQAPAVAEADVTFPDYRLRDGETLERLKMHYATLGTPHRDARGDIDNAVLVLHWTGSSGASVLTPEYMKALFAPGRPLDAGRYFLIVPDNLGHGRSSKPSDGLKAHFPRYGYEDLVDLQHRLVSETLGVRRLHAILGMSMGGMNAWQWAEAFPDEVGAIMPVVSLPVAVSGRNLLWRRLAIDDIRDDPDWRGGDYVKPPMGFVRGFELLRMMVDGVPHLQAIIPDNAAAENYLGAIAKQTAGLDANNILYSLESSRDYNPEPRLGTIKARVYALNFSDDEFNPDMLQILQTRIASVKNARFAVQKGSSTTYGHMTMAHPALWATRVGDFMSSLDSTGSN